MDNQMIGVFPKLNDLSLSWQNKVKIARSAWESVDCIIPNKQQVLLSWVSQQLVDIVLWKKKSCDPRSLKDLWGYLDMVLSGIDTYGNKKQSVVLIPHLLQVFTEIMLYDEMDVVPIRCCQRILSNSELNIAFTSKFETYSLYMSALLSRFSKTWKQIALHEELFSLVEISLKLYIPLQRRQTNHRKLFEKVCQTLLVPIISVWYLLKEKYHLTLTNTLSQERISGLINQLHQVLADALFRKEHLTEYDVLPLKTDQTTNDANAYELAPKAKKAKVTKYTNELFETLRQHCFKTGCPDGITKREVTLFFPQLFLEFLKARRYNKLGPGTLEFNFFKELCCLLGVNFREDATHTELCSHLRHVYALLDTLLKYDVYQVAEDNSNNKPHFKWFNELTNLLIKMQPSHDVFQCFQVLLQLNHYIIEPHLSTVLQYCWTNDQQTGQDMSMCDLFLSSLVKTYTKLRQFDKFIGQMLKSLHTTTNVSGVWNGFARQFEEQLVRSCQSLPYGLATSLWKMFNQEIRDTYLPLLQLLSQNDAKTKSTEQVKHKIFCFERVVGLYRTFLLNTTLGRMAEQHKSEGSISNVSSLCNVLNTEVTGPALEIMSKLVDNKLYKSVCPSVLVLYHTLQEITIFLHKFNIIGKEDTKEIAIQHWDSFMLEYLKESHKKKGTERISYVKVLLAIQRLCIYMRKIEKPTIDNEIQDLIDLVFQWLDGLAYSTSSWNKQLWSINSSTFSTAYWYTLCSNAPILLTVCSDKHRQQFTHYLIKSLLVEDADCNESGVCLQSTSRSLLLSTAFHQTPAMQRSFVVTLWHEAAQLLGSNQSCNISSSLCKIITSGSESEQSVSVDVDMISDDSDENSSSDEDSDDDESEELAPSQTENSGNIPSTISSLVPNGKLLNSVLEQFTSGKQLQDVRSETAKKISSLIALLTFLPLDWLTDVNHVKCVLGLLACDALFNSKESNDESLKVSFVCRRLLSVLLQGCTAKKRYLIHHVIDVNCLHSWILHTYLSPLVEEHCIASQHKDVSSELLTILMRYALKMSKPATLIDGFSKKLIGEVEALTCKLKEESKKSISKALKQDKYLLSISGAVMNVLEKIISHKTSRLSEVKMAAHIFSHSCPSILALLQVIEDKTKSHSKDKDRRLIVLQRHPVLVDMYSAILHVYFISQTSRKFSRSKEEYQQLPWRPLLSSFLSCATKSIVDLEQTTCNENSIELTEENTTSMKSSLVLLNNIISSLDTLELDLPEDFHSNLLASILNFLNHLDTGTKGAIVLYEAALDVVLSLLQGCSFEMGVDLLQKLSNELALATNSGKWLSCCIRVWLTLVSGTFAKTKKRELRSVLPEVIMSLQSIVQQSSNEDLTMLTFELMTKILSLGTNMVQSHHCSLVFHGSLLAPLDHHNKRFPEMFHIQYCLLSTVLYHHSEAVYRSIHVFMACLKNMLVGVCRYCNDKSDEQVRDEKHQGKQFMCTEKLSRLYQEISSHKAALSKYMPYMIAEYVIRVQEILMQESIKKVIVQGIYCLIDGCGDHEISLLYTALDKGSRELFTSLHNDYNKYHKFKGKV